MFTTLALSLFSLVSCVLTAPLPARDVVAPPITSPTASTVWNVGTTQTVTWSTANLPTNITNPEGMLVLGYVANDSENLMLQSPLATNLSYSAGQAQITVPSVPTGNNYIVVLFGDSGNASPQFTIMNSGASSGTPTTATSPPAVTPTTSSSSSSTTTPSSGSPNSASPAGPSSAPVVTVTSTSAITVSASGTSSPASSSTSASVAPQAAASSTQTNAAGSKYVPSSHGLSIGLVLASLVFVL